MTTQAAKATQVAVDTEAAREQRTLNYAKPANASNPGGNPHQVRLSDSIAMRRPGELIEHYERRIARAITQAKYQR